MLPVELPTIKRASGSFVKLRFHILNINGDIVSL